MKTEEEITDQIIIEKKVLDNSDIKSRDFIHYQVGFIKALNWVLNTDEK